MGQTVQEPDALQALRSPEIGAVLERMRDARLAEAEVLTGLLAAAKGGDFGGTPVYLSLRELSTRISFAESTIRAWVAGGLLVEGEHYIRKGRRLRFSWPAVEAWLQSRAKPCSEEVVPFKASRRSRGDR